MKNDANLPCDLGLCRPFTTEITIEAEVQTRTDFQVMIVKAIKEIRDDAERIEVRCISWEQDK